MKHAATNEGAMPRIQFPDPKEGWGFQVVFRDGEFTHPEYVEVTETWVALYYADDAVMVYNHGIIANIGFIPNDKKFKHEPSPSLQAVPEPQPMVPEVDPLALDPRDKDEPEPITEINSVLGQPTSRRSVIDISSRVSDLIKQKETND